MSNVRIANFPIYLPLVAHLLFSCPEGGKQLKTLETTTPKRMFLDIPNAADLAGFSVRHFRRIIEDEQIRIVQIGRKFFILGSDFEKWQATNRRKASSQN